MHTLLIFPYLVLVLTLFFGLIRLFIFVINKTRHKLQKTESISNLNKDFHNFALKTKIKRWGVNYLDCFDCIFSIYSYWLASELCYHGKKFL